MTSIYTQETMLFHTTFYVTNRSAECGLKSLIHLVTSRPVQKLALPGIQHSLSPRQVKLDITDGQHRKRAIDELINSSQGE